MWSVKKSADFHGKDAPEVDFNFVCIPRILIDSILEKVESITHKCF